MYKPLRMCVVCREKNNPKLMLRVVRDKTDNIVLSTSESIEGRGAYVCNSDECVQKCIKNRLFNKSFKRAIPESLYSSLLEEYAKYKN